MSDTFDAIVIGAGPAGEVMVDRLRKGGRRVAVIEAELIGGECAYWACIPSKTLLRAPEAHTEAERAQGVMGAQLDWPELRGYRDYMIRHLDDSAQVAGYTDQGVTVIKGTARITAPRTVMVDDRTLTATDVIIATGSAPLIPPIDGLTDVPVWTNREVTTLTDIPARAMLIGGSAVGVEMSTFLARFGTAVTLVQRADWVLDREDPRVSELAARQLTAAGVNVRTGRTATHTHLDGADTVVTLDDGTEVCVDVIVIGAGRRPRTDGLGVENAGAHLDDHGAITVDATCRAATGVWAVGDVTGIMPFTHVGMYQARVAAENILGGHREAHYDGIPRVVFGDPEIAAVGLTAEQARTAGHDVITSEIDLADSIARPWTYEKDPAGTLGLVADASDSRLLGAYAVGPMASEWIHQAAMAIRARIPIDVLLDGVAQFPTYSESYLQALEALNAE